MFYRILTLCLLFLTIPLPALSDNGKIDTTGPFTDPGAFESVKNALEAEGYRVVESNGDVVCEIWLRNGVPTREPTDVLGAVYTQLEESVLVGILSFPNGGMDYRGQPIKPGAYTMRYEVLPDDGDHQGAASLRDFLLLIPVAADSMVDARFNFEEFVKMSTLATGTNHPAPLNLAYPESEENLPTLTETYEGHVVFTAMVKDTSGAAFPIALIVKGTSDQY